MIENVFHGGFNTKGLVKFAEEDVKRRKKNGETIDHVWIFFDKDSFPKDDFDNAHRKIESKNIQLNDDLDYADKNNICWHSVWSNECFEIWIILHFEYLNSPLPRERYMSKINSEYLCSNPYQKNRTDLYDLLLKEGDVKKAISNAKKLFNTHQTANPSTGVYRFLEYFDKYLTKP